MPRLPQVGEARDSRADGRRDWYRHPRGARHRVRLDPEVAWGPELLGIPLWIVLIVPFARIVATGLSIGSGGSGGIFGPGMVIGAFMGAAVWRLFEPVAPSMGHDPSPYVIVGMMCCFGSISRAPFTVMLMVAEMTGSISILTPTLVGVGLAWLIVHHIDDTIYRSQIRSRSDTEARRLTAGLPLLATIPTAPQPWSSTRLVLPNSATARAKPSTHPERPASAAHPLSTLRADSKARLLWISSCRFDTSTQFGE